MSGYVTFLINNREMAGRLLEMRKIVRAVGIKPLAGTRAPVTSLLILRDLPLPVVDLRSEADADDVRNMLVLVPDSGSAMGLAVDHVLTVLAADELSPIDDDHARSAALPTYVLEVRHNKAGHPVFVVSLRALAGFVPA